LILTVLLAIRFIISVGKIRIKLCFLISILYICNAFSLPFLHVLPIIRFLTIGLLVSRYSIHKKI
jgi:hypothetical protein